MVTCPTCKKDGMEHTKDWKYATFDVQAYECECGTKLRRYSKKGEIKFELMQEKGKRILMRDITKIEDKPHETTTYCS
jgi:lysyl-tRNA synthetase class I